MICLERTKHAKQYVKPAVLKSASMQDMLSKGLMSSDWCVKCEQMDITSKTAKWIVSPLFLLEIKDPLSDSFFSLCIHKWSRRCWFGRTRVNFEAVAGKWNCQCKGTGKSHRCIHRMMAMWWIFQESPSTLMAMSDVQEEDIKFRKSYGRRWHLFSNMQYKHSANLCNDRLPVCTEADPDPAKLAI